MITIFMEYRIDEEKREFFLQHVSEWEKSATQHGGTKYSLLEGVDQPNLFVEAFEVSNLQAYQTFKEYRRNLETFTSLVTGGADKVHVWAFSSVISDKKEL